ncbi:MAG TPA: pyruvate formate lyase family protein [Armatimonadota bacterium]|jgi:formate C-acetyltransferase
MPQLSPATHALAQRALDGEFGRTLVDLPLTLDADRDTLAGAQAETRYAQGVRLIAAHAPVRIIAGERLVGSATLALAPRHALPIYQDGKPAFGSTSHVTLGFEHALRVGYRGLREEVRARLAQGALDAEGRALLDAMLVCLEAAGVWHARYLTALDARSAATTGAARAEAQRLRDTLASVPENPSSSFPEALQALWFLFAFQRLCGNWPGIGRIDEMLGPFLDADLAAGRITLEEARELLAHFWIKGCEWIGAVTSFNGSGDAQHYQNIILGGIDVAGNEVTNAVTYLVLDVVEELAISDFPIAVRLSPASPARLLRRVAEVQARGGGIVAVYNEPLVIESLCRFGYTLPEARRFANDGCWEVQVPGATCFAYRPFDVLALLQETLGVTREAPAPDAPDFDALYALFHARMAAAIEAIQRDADSFALHGPSATLISLLEQDCIANARGYHNRGARYTVLSPHAGGLGDAGNSLLAVQWLVYDAGLLTLPELVEILRANWEGAEALRQRVLQGCPRYGNDDARADAMTRRIFDDFLALVGETPLRQGVLRPAGVSTFGREISWRPARGATADGHRAGEILATNFSPAPGAERQGPTAVIRSYAAMDLVRLANGGALELKLLPDMVQGESGIQALVALLRSFVELGGYFMQVDVVSAEVLRAAQQHPEHYRHLAVRVAGWSARFVTLDADWQEMVIQRAPGGT